MADKDKKTVKKARRQSGKTSSAKNAARRAGSIESFFGMLAGKTTKVATIEEMNEAAAAGWAGLVYVGDEQGRKRDHN
ncbi:MAG TPA: hypothetical protein VMI10_12240 [Terriglobales bacterium]|nr:hypothetical protein [Terriglobales bacterium]